MASFYRVILLVLTFMCGTTLAQTAPGKCTAPRATYAPSASYVRHAGVATLDVYINEKGVVTDAKVLNSSGSDKFDHEAMIAAKKWKFEPSRCDGKPSPAHVAVQMQTP